QFAFHPVQAFVVGRDDQDVLVAPATLLDGVQILDVRLQTTEGAAVLGRRDLHLTPPHVRAARWPSAAEPARRLRCRRSGRDHARGRTRSFRPCPRCPCRSCFLIVPTGTPWYGML